MKSRARDRSSTRGPRREREADKFDAGKTGTGKDAGAKDAAGKAGVASHISKGPRARARIRWVFLAVLAAGAFLFLLIGIRRFPDVFDEGYALYGAERILDGEVPYRDFWLVYAPAQFYVLAVIFKVLGFSIMVTRVYDVLVRFAIVVLMYSIASRLSSYRAALVSALLGTLWLGSIDYYAYAVYPALALSLLGVWFLIRHLEAPWIGWPALCGLAFGATTLFRHDLGLYGSVMVTAVLAAASWFGSGSEDPGRVRAVWTNLWPFVAGVALPVIVVLLALLAAVPAKVLWLDLVHFPAKVLNRYRQLPYPPLPSPGMTPADVRLSVLLYFPIALFACSLVSIPIVWIRRRVMAPWNWGAAALTLLGVFYLRQGLNRADPIHLLPTTLVVAILAPVLLFGAMPSRRRGAWILLIAVCAIAGGDAYVVGPVADLRPLLRPIPPEKRYSAPRGRGIEKVPGEDDAIRYVREHTAEGEAIFVGASHHDQVVVNDILFYFLAERPCATRYHDLTPGVVTTLAVQQEIVSDLESRKVRTIVLCFFWHNVQEPNEGGRSSGVTFLDDYLRSHFKPVGRFGAYLVAERQKDG